MPRKPSARRGQSRRERASQPPASLTPAQHVFCLEYLRNGFNASAAYRAAHPNVTEKTAWELGSRMLRNIKVRTFLDARQAAAWKGKTCDADEVLGRLAGDATSDVRLLFDAHGHLKKPHEWPDAIANSIDSVELRADGGLRIRLVSKLAARRTLLEVSGRLRQTGTSIDELAEAMKRDIERGKHIPPPVDYDDPRERRSR